ncbi:MAG TPA: sugar phosphate isomerase/epimerase [Candidatus Hydrogenedentes bacterium]|nr:sugar phosphate isomerase/epimerase [Candidatus Hydrogenedentota bacterium]HOS01968.1 sugar phosphate isomerase/epimerase [Candidatus Hydrogenedentota bacterium]
MGTVPFGLQLYSVRDYTEKDFAGALRKVKEAGYDFVEMAGTGGVAGPACRALLRDAGLSAFSMHIGFEDTTEKTEEMIQLALDLGVSYAVMPWLGPPLASDKAAWIACAQALGKAGEAFRAHGVQLCYHNHDHEFARLDGECIFDILLRETSPESLAAELDCGWAWYAGTDPVAFIEKHAGRCPLLHIKDIKSTASPPVHTEVGRGGIDWKPIFAAGKAAGVKWFIVEQDECERDSMECVAISATFMAAQAI